MSDRAGPRTGGRSRGEPPGIRYRAVRLPSGELLPIEVRLGRRVLRTIAPSSKAGRELLEAGAVEIVEVVGQRRPPRTTRPPAGWLEADDGAGD